MKKNSFLVNLFVGVRFVLALIFIVSGSEKLLSPVANFIYVIESYQLIPYAFLVKMIAYLFPWVEFFIGLFLLLGLWIRPSLFVVAAVSGGFIVFVGQAMIRKLPLVDCGCFGDLLQLPIWFTFALDWFLLVSSIILYRNIEHACRFSLDCLFDEA